MVVPVSKNTFGPSQVPKRQPSPEDSCLAKTCALGGVGSYAFIFQDEGKMSRVLLRKAADVNWKVCRQLGLSARSENVSSPNAFCIWILPLDFLGKWLILNSAGFCVCFGGVFDLIKDNQRVKDSLSGTVLILPTQGWELEVVDTRGRSFWESRTAAEESAVTFQKRAF